MEEFKIYDVYVKYAEIVLDDGDVLVYDVYSPLPRGHKIESQLVKMSLKHAINKINNASDDDGLLLDHSGTNAYAPSTIKKVRWSKDEDLAKGVYLIDVTASKEKYQKGSKIEVGDNTYTCIAFMDWTAQFGAKLLYCSKDIKVEVVEEAKEDIKEAKPKETK